MVTNVGRRVVTNVGRRWRCAVTGVGRQWRPASCQVDLLCGVVATAVLRIVGVRTPIMVTVTDALCEECKGGASR